MATSILSLALSFFSMLTAGVWAQNPLSPQAASKENCIINVQTKYKTGEIKKEQHLFKFNNKTICESSRKTFTTNFAPDQVDKIEAKMVWRGGK